jgi:hypothetical protein
MCIINASRLLASLPAQNAISPLPQEQGSPLANHYARCCKREHGGADQRILNTLISERQAE